MRTTIKDIANDTGFSVTTISLVLNGKAPKIPEDTKNKIKESARRLKYRPNQLAVSLVKRRSKTIGLIIPDIGNVYFANMAKGIDEACTQRGRTLVLCNTNDSHERDMEYIQMLADKGVDGIIFIMARDSDSQKGISAVKLMEELKVPYILLDRFINSRRYPGIVTNHMTGGYLAARHLIELGHEKIACVTGPTLMANSRERITGFKKALAEAGIRMDSRLIYEGDYTGESGALAVDHLMQYSFTAIFACNDASAYGVYLQLKKYGKRVPEDISVVGYDDVIYAQMLGVPLTTIRQPVYAMGMKAVEQLLKQTRQNEELKDYIIFEPELIVRESTGRRGMG